ncbi:MAG: hypothetical protein IK144_01125 [Bacteroidaceae bacterium]|nr:hypothetical protein [Bacteroidaceae bacterium]
MQLFIRLIRKLFLTTVEEIIRIFGIEWPNINVDVNVSGMSYLVSLHIIYVYRGTKKAIFDGSNLGARGPPVKKRKTASQSSGNGFSNEK